MLSNLMPVSQISDAPLRVSAQPGTWPTLLVVDSDTQMTQTLVCFFEKRGFHVAAGNSLAEARGFFHRRKNWTLIICDYHLSDGTGGELCDFVREQGIETPILLMSGSPHCATLCAGNDYLSKPFQLEKLEAYVQSVRRN